MNKNIKLLYQQITSIILGKESQVKLALVAIFANGHLLIEDIPGIGKTTLAKAISKSLGLEFSRVQCTNDMLPGDILGVSIFDQKNNEFSYHQGPIFSQVLLTDEINRATPKTQSALLEAMEERQVSIDGKTYPLKKPFFVIATQNPREQAGTYPLPESQLDRFIMKISLEYPAREFEIDLLKNGGSLNKLDSLSPVLSEVEVLNCQEQVKEIYVADILFEYIEDLLQFSRSSNLFQAGLSPRAGLSLLNAAKSYAFVEGRENLEPEDIQAVLPYVIANRLRSKETAKEFSFQYLAEIFKQVKLPN